MRYGPFVFLGLLFALAVSWVGMIVTPQFQLGNAQPTNVPPANIIYPTPTPGLANSGREVYRANGCAECHTQVVRQEGTRLEVALTKAGTNFTDVVSALSTHLDISTNAAAEILRALPKTVFTSTSAAAAGDVQKALTSAGATANLRIVPVGPDIERGWGPRLTVGEDYLYDRPLMLGRARIGPDLANIGLRRPDAAWHLVHLYDPKLEVPGSIMPRFPFLFESRPRGTHPSPDALPIPGLREIIPTPRARALVAYLMSLRSEMPLFDAPGPPAPLPAAPSTNQPAATAPSTNVPAVTNAALPANPAVSK